MAADFLLRDFNQFGGRHCESASLKKVLDYSGAGFNGAPLSEEMLLGLGGGVGFIYWYMKKMPAPFIGTRYGGKENFLLAICRRLGVRAEAIETGSVKRGYEALKALLAEGHPAICYGDMAYLPYFAVSESAHFGGHAFVVFGVDEARNRVFISDRGLNPVTVTVEDLQRSRGSKFPPFPPKNRILKVVSPRLEAEILESGIREGIEDCCRAMLNPPIKNLGLMGIEKWAGSVVKWPEQFGGSGLLNCLYNIFLYIEIAGTGGSAFRTMYAGFLDEASHILNRHSLGEAAVAFRESGKSWSEIASAALPDGLPVLKRVKELSVEKNRLFEEAQPGELGRMWQINAELEDLMSHAVEEGNLKPLLTNLQLKIQQCFAAERNAFQILRNLDLR